MNERKFSVGLIFVLLILIGMAIFNFSYVFMAHGIRAQHRAATRSLAEWETEFGRVENWSEVDRAIDMLEYVQNFYQPGEGYHAESETELQLEVQRTRTIEAIVKGLRNYTRRHIGADVARWREWRAAEQGKPES